jgi:hypothetical protein
MPDPTPLPPPSPQFHLDGYRVLRAALDLVSGEGIEPEALEFEVSPAFAYAPEERRVRVFTRVIVSVPPASGEGDRYAFASLETELTASVEGLGDVERVGPYHRLPHLLLTGLLSIAVSMTRGVLWQRGLGTVLQRALLPPFNPQELATRLMDAYEAEAQQAPSSETPAEPS